MIILWPAQYDGSVFYVFTNPTILSGDDLSSSLVGMVKTFLRLLNQQIFTLAGCVYIFQYPFQGCLVAEEDLLQSVGSRLSESWQKQSQFKVTGLCFEMVEVFMLLASHNSQKQANY